MNRLHPADLRALMAAILRAATYEPNNAQSVQIADILMAEVARTEPEDPHVFVPKIHLTAALERADWNWEVACQRQKALEEAQSQLAEARAEGAKAERERLCRKFTCAPYILKLHIASSIEVVSLTFETALRHADQEPRKEAPDAHPI